MTSLPEPEPRWALIEWSMLVWIGATAFFFFLRFTAAFYYANVSAVNALIERLGF